MLGANGNSVEGWLGDAGVLFYLLCSRVQLCYYQVDTGDALFGFFFFSWLVVDSKDGLMGSAVAGVSVWRMSFGREF